MCDVRTMVKARVKAREKTIERCSVVVYREHCCVVCVYVALLCYDVVSV